MVGLGAFFGLLVRQCTVTSTEAWSQLFQLFPRARAQIVSTGDLAKQELAEMKAVAGEEDSGKGTVFGFLLWCHFRVVEKLLN